MTALLALGLLCGLTVVVAAALGYLLLRSPDSDALLRERHIAVVRVSTDLDDRGVRALFARFLAHTNNESAEDLPNPAMRGLYRMNQGNQIDNMSWYMPDSVLVAYGPGEADDWVTAVNFAGFTLFYKVGYEFFVSMMTQEDERGEAPAQHLEHEGFDVYVVDETSFTRAGDTLLVGATLPQLLEVLNPPEAPAHPTLAAAPDERWDAHLAALVGPDGDTQSWGVQGAQGAVAFFLAADVLDGDRMLVELRLRAADPADLPALQVPLFEATQTVIAELESAGMTVEPQPITTEGVDVVGTLRVRGVGDALIAWMERDKQADEDVPTVDTGL